MVFLQIPEDFFCCVRITEEKVIQVPLKEISYNFLAKDFMQDAVITQKFVNEENVPIEAIYSFPKVKQILNLFNVLGFQIMHSQDDIASRR
jgi:hypothetical protein